MRYFIVTVPIGNTISYLHILNSGTGVTLYFQYTLLLSKISLIAIVILLFLDYRSYNTFTLCYVLCIWMAFHIEPWRYMTFSVPNIGLSNPLGQYHPPILFVSLVALLFNIKKLTNLSVANTNVGIPAVNYIIISLIMSS